MVLAAAVALLLALATANVANLFLVRGIERRREFALRAAIGAGRARIARQLVAEGSVLGLLAAGGGILFAWWLLRGLVALAPAELPRLDEIGVDATVVAAGVAVAVLSALASSLTPAAFLGRSDDLTTHLHAGGYGASMGLRAQRGSGALAIAQVAMALVALVGTGLLLRTLAGLQSLEMGFAAGELSTGALEYPAGGWRDGAGRARLQSFYDRVIARLEAVPGVSSATLVLLPPFSGLNGWDASYTVEGQSAAEAAENPSLDLQPVVPGYFQTMGIPIRRGRGIDANDREGAPAVIVVGEALARHAWPGRDPIGKRIKLGTADSAAPWRTVVGIVGDLRYRELTEPRPVVYAAWAQTYLPPLSFLIVRGRAGHSLAVADMRRAVSGEDPAALVTEVSTMRRWISLALARPRFAAVLLGAIAVIAVAVAAVGIYGVMAALVRHRTRELGIRLALGAQAGDLRRLVLARGLALAVIGVATGLAITLPASRLLAAMLYEVSPTDPLTLAAASGLLVALAGLACYLPARTATRLDPLIVLRSD